MKKQKKRISGWSISQIINHYFDIIKDKYLEKNQTAIIYVGYVYSEIIASNYDQYGLKDRIEEIWNNDYKYDLEKVSTDIRLTRHLSYRAKMALDNAEISYAQTKGILAKNNDYSALALQFFRVIEIELNEKLINPLVKSIDDDYFNNLEEKIVNDLKLLTDVVNIKKEYNSFIPDVYEFNKIQDEVEFVAFKISELLDNGIDIKNIKLCNVSSDYNIYIERIFNLYKIPVVLNNKVSLYSTKIGKYFLDNLNKDINVTISLLNCFEEKDIVNKIINICNKYVMEEDYTLIKDLLEYDLKTTYLEEILYSNPNILA